MHICQTRNCFYSILYKNALKSAKKCQNTIFQLIMYNAPNHLWVMHAAFTNAFSGPYDCVKIISLFVLGPTNSYTRFHIYIVLRRNTEKKWKKWEFLYTQILAKFLDQFFKTFSNMVLLQKNNQQSNIYSWFKGCITLIMCIIRNIYSKTNIWSNSIRTYSNKQIKAFLNMPSFLKNNKIRI